MTDAERASVVLTEMMGGLMSVTRGDKDLMLSIGISLIETIARRMNMSLADVTDLIALGWEGRR